MRFPISLILLRIGRKVSAVVFTLPREEIRARLPGRFSPSAPPCRGPEIFRLEYLTKVHLYAIMHPSRFGPGGVCGCERSRDAWFLSLPAIRSLWRIDARGCTSDAACRVACKETGLINDLRVSPSSCALDQGMPGLPGLTREAEEVALPLPANVAWSVLYLELARPGRTA